jgi:hypothetical protein
MSDTCRTPPSGTPGITPVYPFNCALASGIFNPEDPKSARYCPYFPEITDILGLIKRDE